MQSSMPFCYLLQLVELFDLEIHPHTAKNMKLKRIYFAQNVVTGNDSHFQKSWPHEIFKKIMAQHTFKLYLVQFLVKLDDSFFECQLSINLKVPMTLYILWDIIR